MKSFAVAILAAKLLAAQTATKPNFFGLAPSPDPLAVERGQQLFVARCGFCHGSTGKGGNNGPDLVRSVLVLHDEGSGTELGPVILQGRPAKGMPKFAMSEAQIKDIASFLLSLSHAAVNRGDYKILNVVTVIRKRGCFFSTLTAPLVIHRKATWRTSPGSTSRPCCRAGFCIPSPLLCQIPDHGNGQTPRWANLLGPPQFDR